MVPVFIKNIKIEKTKFWIEIYPNYQIDPPQHCAKAYLLIAQYKIPIWKQEGSHLIELSKAAESACEAYQKKGPLIEEIHQLLESGYYMPFRKEDLPNLSKESVSSL